MDKERKDKIMSYMSTTKENRSWGVDHIALFEARWRRSVEPERLGGSGKNHVADFALIAKAHLLESLRELFGVEGYNAKSICSNCYHGRYDSNFKDNMGLYMKHCKCCDRNLFGIRQDNFRPKEPKP